MLSNMEPHGFYDCCFPHHQEPLEQIVSLLQGFSRLLTDYVYRSERWQQLTCYLPGCLLRVDGFACHNNIKRPHSLVRQKSRQKIGQSILQLICQDDVPAGGGGVNERVGSNGEMQEGLITNYLNYLESLELH